MPVANGLAMVLVQGAESLSGHDVHLLMIFGGIIAAALVAQAAGVVAVGIYAARFMQKIDRLSNSFEQKTTPILEKTDAVLTDLVPRARSIGENVEQLSYTVREKVDELGATVSKFARTAEEINLRTRVQVARADSIVTDAMEATAEISATVQEGIRAPLRQVIGIVAGVKAGIETLVSRFPFGR